MRRPNPSRGIEKGLPAIGITDASGRGIPGRVEKPVHFKVPKSDGQIMRPLDIAATSCQPATIGADCQRVDPIGMASQDDRRSPRVFRAQIPDSGRTIGTAGHQALSVGAELQHVDPIFMPPKDDRRGFRIGGPNHPQSGRVVETARCNQVTSGTDSHATDRSGVSPQDRRPWYRVR